MRTARREIAILVSLNIACSAVPLFTLRVDDETAAAMILAYGGTIALLALLYGIVFTIVFGVRRQKWAASTCAVLAITPFLVCTEVAQLVAVARVPG